MNSELIGIEFDWFATDDAGELALFATAGEGTVPPAAANHFSAHSAVSELLETPNWGTDKIWDDYARLGLFVYDWVLPGGPYRRRSVPQNQPTTELRDRIEQIEGLPEMKFKFASTQVANLI